MIETILSVLLFFLMIPELALLKDVQGFIKLRTMNPQPFEYWVMIGASVGLITLSVCHDIGIVGSIVYNSSWLMMTSNDWKFPTGAGLRLMGIILMMQGLG